MSFNLVSNTYTCIHNITNAKSVCKQGFEPFITYVDTITEINSNKEVVL